jgi:hypothetical protein
MLCLNNIISVGVLNAKSGKQAKLFFDNDQLNFLLLFCQNYLHSIAGSVVVPVADS